MNPNLKNIRIDNTFKIVGNVTPLSVFSLDDLESIEFFSFKLILCCLQEFGFLVRLGEVAVKYGDVDEFVGDNGEYLKFPFPRDAVA